MADLKLDRDQVLAALQAAVANAHESINAAAALLGADVRMVSEVLAAPAQHLSINLATHSRVFDIDTISSRYVRMEFGNSNQQHIDFAPELKGKYRVIILINKVPE